MMNERKEQGEDKGEEMKKKEGEESGIVNTGVMELTVGGESRRLVPGDAYYFNSRLPHRFQNPGTVDCVVVSACTPPSF